MKYRGQRRRDRARHIKRRKRLLDILLNHMGISQYNDPDGSYSNNSIMQQRLHRGKSTKTNTRGSYGKSKNWKPHDERQIQDMDLQENESEF